MSEQTKLFTPDQQQFMKSLKGWDCYWGNPLEGEEGIYVNFVCTKHRGDFDTTREFTVSSFSDLQKQVKEDYENFDPDSETMLWVGEDGHGINGAPYHISDIVSEFEELDKELGELADQLATFKE